MSDNHSVVFDGTETGAVVHTTRPAESVVDLLTAAGWQVATLSGVADEASFHTRIAEALGFGGHYGANLDALWDCLTEITRPTALVWLGWAAEFAAPQPRAWGRVGEVLAERVREQPAGSAVFAVVLVDGDPGELSAPHSD